MNRHDLVGTTNCARTSAWLATYRKAATEAHSEQRFGLHGLKQRGVTDTAGNRADKQDAAGHANPETTNRYAHDLPPVPVPPPTRRK